MNKTNNLIESKIKKIFPGRSVVEMMSILDRYGREKKEKEKDRVHLAILKLCEEEKLHDPIKYVETAKIDYRDVLAWAEYPNQLKHKNTFTLKPSELDKLKKLDEEQYLEWLNSD